MNYLRFMLRIPGMTGQALSSALFEGLDFFGRNGLPCFQSPEDLGTLGTSSEIISSIEERKTAS